MQKILSVYYVGIDLLRSVAFDLLAFLHYYWSKRELPDFLAREWQDQANAHILGTRDVFLDVPSSQCFHFHVSEGEVKRDTVDMLSNNHDEADTKICMHVKAADNSDGNVVTHALDTDIAVILLYHCEKSSSHI